MIRCSVVDNPRGSHLWTEQARLQGRPQRKDPPTSHYRGCRKHSSISQILSEVRRCNTVRRKTILESIMDRTVRRAGAISFHKNFQLWQIFQQTAANAGEQASCFRAKSGYNMCRACLQCSTQLLRILLI